MAPLISNTLSGEENALKDHFLIATTKLNGTVFEKALIYIREYDEKGMIGLIINRPLPNLQFKDLFPELSHHFTNTSQKHIPVIHYGGPIEHFKGFILHSGDFQNEHTLQIGEKVFITGDKNLLINIAQCKGPKHSLFILGYATWTPEQIEKELKENYWIILPMNEKILFNTQDANKWQNALRASGIRPSKLSPSDGHA